MEELRENFAIKSSQIEMELELLLEKTKKIERALRDAIRQEVSETDFFTPHAESVVCLPPKKKTRMH
jgi:hypothetical protein